MKIITKFIICAVMPLVVSYSQTTAANDTDLGVMPIQSDAFGKSYGEWGEKMAQWLFQFSLEEYPLFQPSGDADCVARQNGKVWFLYGALEDGIERYCTIPPGKALFITVNSTVSFVPEFGGTEEEIREDAARDLAGITSLEVMIDGVPLENPYSYQATSPDGGFVLTIEEDTILSQLGYPAGDRDPTIVDGYYIMLRPLSVGEHEIQWYSSGLAQDGSYYSYGVTWHLTVSNQ